MASEQLPAPEQEAPLTDELQLRKALQLILVTEAAINQIKSNRSLGAAQKARSIAIAVEEKNRALQHARELL